jgi:Xaa-Pro aminopeptidase
MTFVERICSIPGKAGVDILVAMSPENFSYVSQSYIITVEMIRPRQAFAIIPKKGEPIVLICSIEESLTKEESWIRDIRTYTEFTDYPIDALVSVLKDLDFKKGKLGIDLKYLPYLSYARLAELLPGVEIVDTTDAVAKERAIKTDKEVSAIEFAAKATHTAALEAMAESTLGESEKVMANKMITKMMEKGASGTFFLVFGSSLRTALTHGMPTNRVPKESEIIRFDFGGRFGMWTSDFARVYSTGKPTEMQRKAYRDLKEIQEETIKGIKPGILAEELFHKCEAGYERRKRPFFMPHIGHGFGIELHEYPMLRPGNKTLIEKGMVLNIEPILKDEEGCLYHLEDLVAVTENGHRILTLGLPPAEIPVIGKAL